VGKLFAGKAAVVVGATLATLCLCAPVRAQQHFSSLFVFGDSLSDPGNRFALDGGTDPASPPYFQGRGSNGPVASELLSGLLGFSVNNATNFAVAGAPTSGTPASVLGADQLGKFQTNFGTVPAGALVEIYAGANDYNTLLPLLGNAPAITALVNSTVADLGTAVTQLAHAGGKVFLVPGLDLGYRPLANPANSATVATVATQHNQTLVATLASLRASLGVTIVYVDTQALYNDIRAHPAVYGFTNLTVPCLTVNTTNPSGACGTTLVNGVYPSSGVLYYDGTHPTEQAQIVIAEFDAATISATLEAPRAAAAMPQLAFANVTAQQQAILGRLTAMRLGPDGAAAMPSVASSPPLQFASAATLVSDRAATLPQLAQSAKLTRDLSLSFDGAYAFGGTRGTATQVGFDYGTYIASISLDERLSPNALVGAALTFADGHAMLDLGDGHTDVRNYMASLYGSWSRGGAFADGLIGASYDDYYDIGRATSFPFYPTATASPGGYSAFVVVDGGYLFDLGTLWLGPLLGIRYTHSVVDGYEETGASMLDLTVGRQAADSVIGSLGLEATTHVRVAGYDIAPNARLSMEHEFADGSRSVTTSLSGGLPNTITTRGAKSTDGRVAGGVKAQLSPDMMLALEFDSSFGRSGNDNLLAAQLRVAW
jgi:outer membrane lipase/esterase